MKLSRRSFVKASAAMLPIGFAACQDNNHSKDVSSPSIKDRNLVVLYLAGGNDALSYLIPYSDPDYYRRRPTQAIAANETLNIGQDRNGTKLGLHPSLTGLKNIYEQGNSAIVQRVGYQNASRSHFLGNDIVSTADLMQHKGNGWLGRYMDTLPGPIDPLFGWNTQFQLPRAFFSQSVQVSSIADPNAFVYYNPWNEVKTATQLAAIQQESDTLKHLSQTAYNALSTLDRVKAVAPYKPSTEYPTTKLGESLKLVASAITSGVGTKIFWVQMAGFDTHSNQGTRQGRFNNLMLELDQAVFAFHNDLQNQNQLDNTLLLQYSEFGRRIDENGSGGTDHGAAGLMNLVGGSLKGGLYGTASKSLAKNNTNPDLENKGFDVRPDVDFRAVYAEILEQWLKADSQAILGADFRDPSMKQLFT